ncbi:MAG: hypothetical protein ACOX1I_02350 [Dethiobacteria bacterium]|jgi:hypothetical protein
MGDKYRQRCLICGRVFEIGDLAETTLGGSFYGEPPRSKSICPLCEAKIRKEAEGTQKDPKPM